MAYFVGLDVLLEETAICVVDTAGEIKKGRARDKKGRGPENGCRSDDNPNAERAPWI